MATREREREVPSVLLDELRRVFAAGDPAGGEKLLAAALDAGVPWNQATRAVAEGIARHFETYSAQRWPANTPGQRANLRS